MNPQAGSIENALSEIDDQFDRRVRALEFSLNFAVRHGCAERRVTAKFRRTIASMSAQERELARAFRYLEFAGIYEANSKICSVLAWGEGRAEILNWQYWFEDGNSPVHDGYSAVEWVMARYGVSYDAEISKFVSTVERLEAKYPDNAAVRRAVRRLQAKYVASDLNVAASSSEAMPEREVFISYARLERARVEPIKRKLEALGVSVFFDVEGIDGGVTFPDVIDQALRKSRAILCVWSPTYFQRPWCLIECRNAKAQNRLVPVAKQVIDEFAPPADLQGVNYYNLSGWTGADDHEDWNRTRKRLGALIGRPIG